MEDHIQASNLFGRLGIALWVYVDRSGLDESQYNRTRDVIRAENGYNAADPWTSHIILAPASRAMGRAYVTDGIALGSTAVVVDYSWLWASRRAGRLLDDPHFGTYRIEAANPTAFPALNPFAVVADSTVPVPDALHAPPLPPVALEHFGAPVPFEPASALSRDPSPAFTPATADTRHQPLPDFESEDEVMVEASLAGDPQAPPAPPPSAPVTPSARPRRNTTKRAPAPAADYETEDEEDELDSDADTQKGDGAAGLQRPPSSGPTRTPRTSPRSRRSTTRTPGRTPPSSASAGGKGASGTRFTAEEVDAMARYILAWPREKEIPGEVVDGVPKSAGFWKPFADTHRTREGKNWSSWAGKNVGKLAARLRELRPPPSLPTSPATDDPRLQAVIDAAVQSALAQIALSPVAPAP